MSKVYESIMSGLEEAVTLKQVTEIFKGIPAKRVLELAAAERDGCTYKQEEWEEMIFTCSHCGETWCYDCGNPFENNQNFCGHCGYPIKAIIVLDRDDDYDLVEKTLTREAAEAALAGKGE